MSKRDWSSKEPKYPALVEMECSHCKTPFKIAGNDYAKKLRRGSAVFFCSIQCANRFRVKKCEDCKGPTGERHRRFCPPCATSRRRARWQQLTPVPCPVCKKDFLPKSSRAQFCSRRCADKAHSLRMRGAGNPHFKTGDSYTKLFIEMRPLIQERDGGCVVCGTTKGRMPVHHIDSDPKNNDPKNLIWLCQPHHSRHHKSAQTPYPWFAGYAAKATSSMTSRWRAATTSLLEGYSSTTA